MCVWGGGLLEFGGGVLVQKCVQAFKCLINDEQVMIVRTTHRETDVNQEYGTNNIDCQFSDRMFRCNTKTRKMDTKSSKNVVMLVHGALPSITMAQ